MGEFGCASHVALNHTEGEIVDLHRNTTNHIEPRWSVMKRWLRKRAGGKVPSGRLGLQRYLREFQFRKAAEGSVFLRAVEALALVRSGDNPRGNDGDDEDGDV